MKYKAEVRRAVLQFWYKVEAVLIWEYLYFPIPNFEIRLLGYEFLNELDKLFCIFSQVSLTLLLTRFTALILILLMNKFL
jgi:hypothetical protein